MRNKGCSGLKYYHIVLRVTSELFEKGSREPSGWWAIYERSELCLSRHKMSMGLGTHALRTWVIQKVTEKFPWPVTECPVGKKRTPRPPGGGRRVSQPHLTGAEVISSVPGARQNHETIMRCV